MTNDDLRFPSRVERKYHRVSNADRHAAPRAVVASVWSPYSSRPRPGTVAPHELGYVWVAFVVTIKNQRVLLFDLKTTSGNSAEGPSRNEDSMSFKYFS